MAKKDIEKITCNHPDLGQLTFEPCSDNSIAHYTSNGPSSGYIPGAVGYFIIPTPIAVESSIAKLDEVIKKQNEPIKNIRYYLPSAWDAGIRIHPQKHIWSLGFTIHDWSPGEIGDCVFMKISGDFTKLPEWIVTIEGWPV